MKKPIMMAMLSLVGICLAGENGRFVDVSKNDPHYFAELDGRTWIPVGCNICFERLAKPTAEAKQLFDGWMTKFAANGGNFMRLWLSQPFLEVMPDRAGEFSTEATENLKWIVRRAEELGIRLKFTFENFRKVAPKIEDCTPEKGIVSFTRPAYAAYAKNIHEFFTSEACFNFYLAKARHIAEAVGSSPAVICVELWNEVTSTGVPLPILAKWTDRMIPELQKIFPRQMVVQNLGSFSEIKSLRDYDWLASLKGNAFLQAHRYQDLGAPMDIVRGPIDVLCADAVRELRDRRNDMPVFLSEVGAVKSRHTGPSEFYAMDKDGIFLHDEIFAPFFAGSAGCGQPWHWDHQYIDGMNLWYHFGRFAKAIKGSDPVAEGFRPFHMETYRLRVYGLRGRSTFLVWCRDKKNDWRSEFLEKKAPEFVTNEELPFAAPDGFSVYLPFEDREVKVETGTCILPAFKRSCVIRFKGSVK